jgi:hypothetical protein
MSVSNALEVVPIREYGNPDSDKNFKKRNRVNQSNGKKELSCFYGDFDLSPYLEKGQV